MSSVGSLSPELRQFIARHIQSVEQVEILCLLSSAPGRTWTVPEVFRQIQSSERSVAETLTGFVKLELVTLELESRYRYAPKTEELAQAAAALVAAYRERRVAVIEAIYTRPTEPLQNFAEAFRLRKEK